MSELIIAIVGHFCTAVPVYVLALKNGHELKWLAFVPVANYWLLCDIADVEFILIVGMCFPLLGLAVWVYVWLQVCEMMGRPTYLAYLMLIPFVSVAVAFYIAFHEEEDTGPDLLAGKS